MIDGWTLYWITRLDGLNILLQIFGGVAVAVIFVSIIFGGMCHAEEGKWPRIASWGSGIGGLLAMLVAMACVLVPTTKEAAVILVVPAIANNETVQGEAGELYQLAKHWLEKQAGEEETGDD